MKSKTSINYTIDLVLLSPILSVYNSCWYICYISCQYGTSVHLILQSMTYNCCKYAKHSDINFYITVPQAVFQRMLRRITSMQSCWYCIVASVDWVYCLLCSALPSTGTADESRKCYMQEQYSFAIVVKGFMVGVIVAKPFSFRVLLKY